MKKTFYFFLMFYLYSCNGGNMNEGIKVGPDTANGSMDSSGKASKQKIDSGDVTLPTDTAAYKSKPGSSHR
ncbi:MAG: hypothetical protein QM737_15650 [Ferruginibacter sp.]